MPIYEAKAKKHLILIGKKMLLPIYKAKMVFHSLIRMKMYHISVSSMKKLILCLKNETAKSAT
jgi:hypothetical protein